MIHKIKNKNSISYDTAAVNSMDKMRVNWCWQNWGWNLELARAVVFINTHAIYWKHNFTGWRKEGNSRVKIEGDQPAHSGSSNILLCMRSTPSPKGCEVRERWVVIIMSIPNLIKSLQKSKEEEQYNRYLDIPERQLIPIDKGTWSEYRLPL